MKWMKISFQDFCRVSAHYGTLLLLAFQSTAYTEHTEMRGRIHISLNTDMLFFIFFVIPLFSQKLHCTNQGMGKARYNNVSMLETNITYQHQDFQGSSADQSIRSDKFQGIQNIFNWEGVGVSISKVPHLYR